MAWCRDCRWFKARAEVRHVEASSKLVRVFCPLPVFKMGFGDEQIVVVGYFRRKKLFFLRQHFYDGVSTLELSETDFATQLRLLISLEGSFSSVFFFCNVWWKRKALQESAVTLARIMHTVVNRGPKTAALVRKFPCWWLNEGRYSMFRALVWQP